MSTQYQQDGPAAGRPLIRSGSKRPRRAAASALAVGLTVLCGTWASSASAAVPGLQLVTETSVADSVSPKTVTAVCPAGKRLLGVGDEIKGGFGQVVIDDLTPSLTTVRVTAYEGGNGTAASWSLRAFAICANPVPGLQLVSNSAVSNSVKGTGVTATCPVGKKLVGTGGELSGALGQVVMDDITPSSTLNSVRVTGFEDGNGTAANWTVRAYAICANPLPGLQLVSASSAFNSVSPKLANVTCPAGKKLIGTGGDFSGALGRVAMNDIDPSTLTSLMITGYEDANGLAANWSSRALGICATA